ncbi:3'(2'),5'-bisphosphate nucleotidase CysQ [Acinetobacter sp. A3.8]|uniref:3'(2'),5'-bisphosphate nucleotidase CysQ n=1 Tax=Acinetobacter sedimenti TaxID=2919922 RepID=A0A9X1WWK8_9GAMM|nr:3'(2'),5'-bisphosphate nucleotidase CysQ [Acinetobacter sedimenti]MCJ8146494.1 3'(2'),5'-bisphosphate nucleotidase CysQ [Acinetobacter sedimenti]
MFAKVALEQMPQNLQQLSHILQQASAIIVAEYERYQRGGQFQIERKSDNSPVTQADLKAHRFISQALAELTPKLPLLSEEGEHNERHQWQRFWMLDPLDGTKEFIDQTGEFTINLSLIENGGSVISAIAVPLMSKLYIVEKFQSKEQLPYRYQWNAQGQIELFQFQHDLNKNGLKQNDLKNDKSIRIAMSRRPERSSRYQEFLDFLTSQNISYRKVNAGSAYKFCMMIEGEIDLYPRFHPTSEWDTSAGQGLLQSIGGEVFDLSHRPFRYNQRTSLLNGQFIALRDVRDWTVISGFVNTLINKR